MDSIIKDYINTHDVTPEMVMYLSQLELVAKRDARLASLIVKEL